jgi:hypothetical protein
MSLRAISDKLTVQNKLIVDFTDEQYQKNSDRVQDSFDGLNDSVSSIASFLKKEDDEGRTDESRRRLKSKDDESDTETQSKGLFGGLLNSDNKKSSGGLLGKIFSKALGFLVKSLPLIGLAALFFGDVVTGLLTAAFGDYDKASILKNILVGGLLGSILGFRGAIIGSILGLIFSPAAQEMVREEFDRIAKVFKEEGFLAAIGELGPLAKGLGILAIALAPFRTIKMAWGALKGTLNLIGGLFGLKGMGAVVGPNGVKTPTKAANVGNKIGGALKAGTAATTTATAAATPAASKMAQRLANTEATRNLTDKQKLALNQKNFKISKDGVIVDQKNRMVPVDKQTAALKSVGAGTAKSAGTQAAKTVGKKAMLGTVAKAIPGLGILAGVGFGINALMKGDPVAAGLHVASGIVGTIPGLGTAASIGLTGAAVARESGMLGGGGGSDLKVEVDGKSEVLNDATRERDELVAKTSSNVIMDNSTTNNVSGGGGGGVSISSPITFFDDLDPYLNSGR